MIKKEKTNYGGYLTGDFSSCFIIMNTTTAIIKKSITLPIKLPTIITTGPKVNVASLQAPPGIKNVTTGIKISATRLETSFPAAPPIITAMANPITPYLDRNA